MAVTAALREPRDGAIYAALKHGHFGPKLHRSDDGGRNFAEIGSPAFPADAAGAPSVFQYWTLETGGPHHPDRLWMGAIPAGLFRSEDRGATWQLVDSLWNVPERDKWFGGGYDDAGIHSVSPDPRDGNRPCSRSRAAACGRRVTTAKLERCAARACRQLYATGPAGTADTQDPHRLVRCPSAPRHACGCSITAASSARAMPVSTLTQIKPPGDDFGFAVAVHPSDPETAWLAPAIKDELRMPRDGAMYVHRTTRRRRDLAGVARRPAATGRLRPGLSPRARRGCNGSALAMGSTTGALWVSDNGGEAWQLVNAHLPPIYAVRFG